MILVVLILLVCVHSKQHRIVQRHDIDKDTNSEFNKNARYCLWMCGSGWDADFIQEIFPFPTYIHINFKSFVNFFNHTELFRPKVMVFNIENSRADADHDLLTSLILRFKPGVLVHISDEFLGQTG